MIQVGTSGEPLLLAARQNVSMQKRKCYLHRPVFTSLSRPGLILVPLFMKENEAQKS